MPLVTEETTASTGNAPAKAGWMAGVTTVLGRIGADPRDDQELRQKKTLLVLLAVLIAPVSVIWGILYLALGSWVGIAPLVYCAISVASLVVFARTKSFRFLLAVQLLDILVAPTAGGQMLVGGFLPSGAVGLWGILAPMGALVFLDVRQAVRWFVAFLFVFLLTGILGEVLFADADLPLWFTSTMLALNIVGAASIAFMLLATFAHQRNEALVALRVEQEKSEALLVNVLPGSIAARLKATDRTIADHFDATSILFADVVDFTPLSQRLPPAEMVDILDRLFSHFDTLVERHGLEKIKTVGDCYMAAAGVPDPHEDHARRAALVALDMRDAGYDLGGCRSGRSRASDRDQLGSGRRRRDRPEALHLRPVERRREHGEPDGVPRHARRDPDHPRDVRAVEGRVRLPPPRHDRGQGQRSDGDLVPRRNTVRRSGMMSRLDLWRCFVPSPTCPSSPSATRRRRQAV